MAGFSLGDMARSGATAPWGATVSQPQYASGYGAAGQPGRVTTGPVAPMGGTRMPPIVPPAGGTRMPPIMTPVDSGPGRVTTPGYGGMVGSPPQFGGMPGPSGGGMASLGGARPNNAVMSTPDPMSMGGAGGGQYANPTNAFTGAANYGPGASVDWRQGWDGNLASIQGAQGKVNIGNWNAQAQADREAQHRAQVMAQRAGMPGPRGGDMPGAAGGLTGQAKVNALLAQGNQQSQDDPAQMERWANSTNPLEIEGKPLETWNPAQLQAGLAHYTQAQAGAVPGSNEWNMYQDRINSINANLSGNRSPWAYPSQGGAGYFGNNAGTPAGGWNLGSGPRS